MGIDPTAPLNSITPAAPPGSQPNSVVLQAVARAVLADAVNTLGELVGRPSMDAGKPHQGVEQAAKASAQDAEHATVSSGSEPLAPTAARPPSQETRLMRAVRIAAADAVPRQAGIAPLMADLRAVLDHPDTPSQVRIAGETLLARLPSDFEISKARGLKRAVEQSGVFLEARLAKSNALEIGGAAQVGRLDGDMKAALLIFKAALGDWLARAPQPAGEAVKAAEFPVEPPVRQSEAAPLSDRATPEPRGAPEAERFRAPMAEGASIMTVPVDETARAPEDVVFTGKAKVAPEAEDIAPTTSANVVASFEDDQVVEPRFAAFLAPPRSTHPSTDKSEPAPPGLLGLVEGAIDDEAEPPLANASFATRGYGVALSDAERPKSPPPPFADGPMAGQRARVSDLPPHVPPEEIVRRLLKGASAALARQELMQIASLREVHHDPETGEARPQPPRLNLDLAFVTPQGVAVAQFEITRDGGGAGGGAVGPAEHTHRVRFSIDVEPLGPVYALVTLTGARTRVSLWAERAETIARLRAGEEGLGAALRQAELVPEIAVHSGPPPVKDARAVGHFVDQAS